MVAERLIVAGLLILTLVGCHRTDTATPRMNYPPTHKGDVVDDYGAVKVPDPYRWMETLDSKEVADWVKAQNAVTEPYLERLPLRKHFHDRLTQLWNYARVAVPQIEQGSPLLRAQHRPAAAIAGVHAHEHRCRADARHRPECHLRRRLPVALAVEGVA